MSFHQFKVNKMTYLRIISNYGGATNIKFEEQVHLLKRIPWGTPSQDVVKLLPNNPITLTNLHISSYGY